MPTDDAAAAGAESSADAHGTVNAVGGTCLITAAFRAIDLQFSTSPIVIDPLASHLGRAVWDTAHKDWQQLVALQGSDKSLRIPARNRLVDDLLQESLQRMTGVNQVQVVNIGCGMDSKPWRMQRPVPVTWFDIDQPAVITLKQQLLQEAGAAVAAAAAAAAAEPAPSNSIQQQPGIHPSPAAPGAQGSQEPPGSAPVQFPLLVDAWRPVPTDLSKVSLTASLEAAGFDRSTPTVWICEALLYYLPLDQALKLLSEMRSLSAPASRLIATCIDRELYIADHERMDKGHYFHAMWHFSIDDLMQAEQQRLREAGWAVELQPRTTADLALERYGRLTYVPVYGGAECIFTAQCV